MASQPGLVRHCRLRWDEILELNLRQHWQKMLDGNREYYHEDLDKDPFEKWQTNRSPADFAEQFFICGIQILMVEPDNRDGARYLETCTNVAQKAFDENRLQAKECVIAFPRNRAKLLRCMSYSEAIFNGEITNVQLLQASHDYESWCVKTMKQKWDDQIQAYYLAGARLALIAGDSARAVSLLSKPKHFKAHPEQSQILKQLATGAVDESVEASLNSYFDFVRNPFSEINVFLEPDVQAFEIRTGDFT